MTATPRQPFAATALSALLVALVAVAPLADAQAPQGLSVTPGRVEQVLTGRDVDVALTVTNHDERASVVDVELSGLAQDADGAPRYEGEVPLAVSPAELHLAGGERATVRVTGRLPEGAAGLYGAVLLTPRGGDATAGVNVVTRTRMAALLLLVAPDALPSRMRLDTVGLARPDPSGPLRPFTVTAHAEGPHGRPAGSLIVTDPDGTVLGEGAFGPETVLPGQQRRLFGPPVEIPEGTEWVRVTARLDDGSELSAQLRIADLPERVPDAPEEPGATRWPAVLAAALLLLTTAALAAQLRRRP